MLDDPLTNLLRVATHQQLGSVPIGNLMPIRISFPSCMEPESRPLRDAKVIAWDYAKHHGARRHAGAINHHILAGVAQRFQFVQVRPDLATWIAGDSYCR
jgi:hypothetical protein